jgi:hypothetical protein
MPRWLPAILRRVRQLAAQGRVRFTIKALRELAALELGLDADDAIEVVVGLKASDFADRIVSEHTDEWLYVFKPKVTDTIIYIKLAVRSGCIILSFHEDQEDDSDYQ